MLFVGYILMQVPSNLFLNKIGRPSMYLTGCMAVWVSVETARNGTSCALNMDDVLGSIMCLRRGHAQFWGPLSHALLAGLVLNTSLRNVRSFPGS